jgi:hypothetical protein
MLIKLPLTKNITKSFCLLEIQLTINLISVLVYIHSSSLGGTVDDGDVAPLLHLAPCIMVHLDRYVLLHLRAVPYHVLPPINTVNSMLCCPSALALCLLAGSNPPALP